MADLELAVAAPSTPIDLAVDGGGGGRRAVGRSLRQSSTARHVGALAPFAIYTALFLLVPAVAVAVGAFQSASGRWTFSNIRTALSGVYLNGFENSLQLSAFTAVIPAICGAFVAYAIHRGRPTSFLRRVVVTISGVFANFGGVPLAFLFISSLGTTGLATGWLADIGISLPFSLFSIPGIELVYVYFQVPLMVIIFLPALEGLRPAWREAAHNLGARSWQFWRYVGIPVLAPTFFGCVLLLFGFGLSAYATADALTSGSIALTPIQIGSFLNGNVLAGQQNVGKALGFGMLVILAVVMGLYTLVQRRISRWVR